MLEDMFSPAVSNLTPAAAGALTAALSASGAFTALAALSGARL